ncbi:hypothetical protein DRJ24_00780, partial [Candidatus Acetothermia bacterium]
DPGEGPDPRPAGGAEVEARIGEEVPADPAPLPGEAGKGRETPIANDLSPIGPPTAQGALRRVEEGEDPLGDPCDKAPPLR